MDYAGELAAKLEPGGFYDFPVNKDTKSGVFHPGGNPDAPVKNKPTHYRLRANTDGKTYHGFPIDGTAEPIKGTPAKFK